MAAQPDLPMPDEAMRRAWLDAAEASRRQFPNDTKRAAYYEAQARLYEAGQGPGTAPSHHRPEST